MILLGVNQIIESQSLTFMHKAFKVQLPVNLHAHFNLIIGNKRCLNIFKCECSRTTKKQKCLSLIGARLWNKTDMKILNSYIHNFKKN